MFLEDCAQLLPWGAPIHELAGLLQLPMGKNPTQLAIGHHLVLRGLRLNNAMVSCRGAHDGLFNTFSGRVRPEALDHLADKFDLSLQPTSPGSTVDGGAEMFWRSGPIEISYSTLNLRGEGIFESLIEVVYLGPLD